MKIKSIVLSAALTIGLTAATLAQVAAPAGEINGDGWVHTPTSLAASAQLADVCIPSIAKGGQMFYGKLKDAPKLAVAKVPTIVFLHGSSGLGLKAIGEWQRWLCDLGYASVAPDSFTLPNHVTYKSPIDKTAYEKIHALRASEIPPALTAIIDLPWVDSKRLVLAGTSEGSVPVARFTGAEFAGRMMFAWSCEQNYFVTTPMNGFDSEVENKKPILNIISTTDPFFSKSNTWLGNPDAQGHCAAALKGNPRGSVLLIPNAPHTLINFPAARIAVAGFMSQF